MDRVMKQVNVEAETPTDRNDHNDQSNLPQSFDGKPQASAFLND